MTPPQIIRVLLVDDHAVVRGGLSFFLSTTDDIQVVGEAADGEQALRLCAQLRPDVVLIDMLMPRMDGFTAPKRYTWRCSVAWSSERAPIQTPLRAMVSVAMSITNQLIGFLRRFPCSSRTLLRPASIVIRDGTRSHTKTCGRRLDSIRTFSCGSVGRYALSLRRRAFDQFGFQIQGLLAAQDRQRDRITRLIAVDDLGEV
jgi:CheY-like chemotaxis protein